MIQPRICYIPIEAGNFDLPCTNETKLWEKGTMWYFLVKTPRWFACSVNFETHFRLCLPSKTGHFHSILLLYFENKAKAAAWRILIWETDSKFLIKQKLFGSCNQYPWPHVLPSTISTILKLPWFKYFIIF